MMRSYGLSDETTRRHRVLAPRGRRACRQRRSTRPSLALQQRTFALGGVGPPRPRRTAFDEAHHGDKRIEQTRIVAHARDTIETIVQGVGILALELRRLPDANLTQVGGDRLADIGQVFQVHGLGRCLAHRAYHGLPPRTRPTAMPSIANAVCLGSTVMGRNCGFSGRSTIAPPRRCRRLTVTSSSRRATTICPGCATALLCTASRSPSRIPAPCMLLPCTRKR